MEILSHKVISKNKADQWVVFLHGAGGSTKTWKDQVEAYQDHFQLLLIDLRDHGNSKNIQPAYNSYNLDVITTDIFKVLDLYDIRSAHFVCLSMGSFIMQSVLLQRPELVQKCVLAGAVILGNWRIRTFTRIALQFNHILSYKQMYNAFSFLLMPRKLHQRARKIYRIQAQKLTQEEYMKWLGLYHEFFKLLKRFSDWKIQPSTLLLMGSQDYVFLKSARDFAKGHERVSFQVVPNSGHICNIDNSLEFNRISIDFLRR